MVALFKWIVTGGAWLYYLTATPDFIPFREFLISPINCIISQYWDYVYALMTGLFAWNSLTALSRPYFTIVTLFRDLFLSCDRKDSHNM